MTQGSSLPPLKKNDGKYGLVALLLLLSAGGLWLFLKPAGGDSEPQAEVAAPAPEVAREQFAPEIEIPELDAAIDGVEEQEPSREAPPSPDDRPADWICDGTLSASQLSEVIRGQPSKQVQTCYEQRLKENNLLQGSMTVLLTIGASGSVKAVSLSGSLGDPQVYACVKRIAKTWKFPQPEGGCVRTAVPFQMTPKL
ncbi:MAG TPA: AgmX/PglI C-terminal domain-containing protein [Polyangiales bacterium]|nr:AgmX/PglI C-terminal domain-containing protein [Polyangiales bacterium]